MRIDVLTLFPEMFDSLKSSIIGKALEKNLFDYQVLLFFVELKLY